MTLARHWADDVNQPEVARVQGIRDGAYWLRIADGRIIAIGKRHKANQREK